MGVLRGLVMDMVAVQKMTELMMMIVYFLVMMMIDDDDEEEEEEEEEGAKKKMGVVQVDLLPGKKGVAAEWS